MTLENSAPTREPFIGTPSRIASQAAAAVAAPVPGALPSSPSLHPRDVIGRDDRHPVPDSRQRPWCQVCHLVIEDTRGSFHTGTGWLAGPSTVFTAGHNLLYRRQGHEAVRVWVMPGRAGATAPGGQWESRAFDVHPQWRATGRAEADVGVVWLPEPAGQALGWFGFSAQPDSVLQGLPVRTAGYPDDLAPFGSQWFVDGRVAEAGAAMLAYALDTMGGQSGSPVFTFDADGRAVAVGIHVYGAVTRNLALRITQPVFDTLSAWWR